MALFYFHGKSFETYEDFKNYSREWGNCQLDKESMDQFFNGMRLEIELNINNYNLKLTRREFSKLLEKHFYELVREMVCNSIKNEND